MRRRDGEREVDRLWRVYMHVDIMVVILIRDQTGRNTGGEWCRCGSLAALGLGSKAHMQGCDAVPSATRQLRRRSPQASPPTAGSGQLEEQRSRRTRNTALSAKQVTVIFKEISKFKRTAQPKGLVIKHSGDPVPGDLTWTPQYQVCSIPSWPASSMYACTSTGARLFHVR
jgi:hypothetical protein